MGWDDEQLACFSVAQAGLFFFVNGEWTCYPCGSVIFIQNHMGNIDILGSIIYIIIHFIHYS